MPADGSRRHAKNRYPPWSPRRRQGRDPRGRAATGVRRPPSERHALSMDGGGHHLLPDNPRCIAEFHGGPFRPIRRGDRGRPAESPPAKSAIIRRPGQVSQLAKGFRDRNSDGSGGGALHTMPVAGRPHQGQRPHGNGIFSRRQQRLPARGVQMYARPLRG